MVISLPTPAQILFVALEVGLYLESGYNSCVESEMVIPDDDYRHALTVGEHEAFYFLFSTPDGRVFGFLRTLFGHDSVLELFALRVGDRTWLHEQRVTLPGDCLLAGEASGPGVMLACQTPWQAWRCLFRGRLQEVEGEAVLEVDLDLVFTATNTPNLYHFGPYHQVQQDGQLRGRLQAGPETCFTNLIGYRDHSWGTRVLGTAAGWTIASVPDRLYIVVIDQGQQQAHWGRFARPGQGPASVRAPQVTCVDDGWCLRDIEAGLEPLKVQRLAPPVTAFLGPAGQESIRLASTPKDLYQDIIGPAVFLFPDGKQVTGFWDQARRLS